MTVPVEVAKVPLPQTPQDVDPREEANVPIEHDGQEAIAPVPAVPKEHLIHFVIELWSAASEPVK